MKKHLIHTLISAMVLWGVYGPAAALSAEDDQVFLEMINKIREAPYDYAIGLECDPDDLSAKGIEQKTRFDAYTLDTDLSDTAAYESKLMAGEDIPESEKPPVRRRLTASTGGVVSFFNFMSRDKAFEIVINYLLKKELDPDNESPRYILSENTYSSVGIAISAGKVGSGNAWFVSICFGSPELVSEIQMLNLINQVRADPRKILEYAQLNEATAIKLNRNLPDLIYIEYKPLFFDPSLSEYARAHSSYLLNRTYREPLSKTQTTMERAVHCGYEGYFVQESDVPVRFATGESSPPVDSLFVSLIYKELIAWPRSYVVFLKDFQDVGFSMSLKEDESYNTSVLSFVVGKKDPNTSTSEQTVRIYGVLFSDIDGKGLYAPGYELIQQTVKVYNNEMQEIKSAVTDNAGHFFMELPANQQYSFTATIDGVEVSWEGNDGDYLITSDQFVKLKLPYSPPSLENDLLSVDLQ